MVFKRFSVLAMNSWGPSGIQMGPTKFFWTMRGARKFFKKQRDRAYIYRWEEKQWKIVND